MKLKYEVGDSCWIALGAPPLWEGRVVASYTTPDHPADFYLIEVLNPDWPTHEVRDALLMAETEDAPLAYMQGERSADEDSPMTNAEDLTALVENMEGLRVGHSPEH